MENTGTLDRNESQSNNASMPPGFVIHTRSGGTEAESAFEKPVVLPDPAEQAPSLHAWADARFAVDIMAEHALFFALLMPPELAADERAEAQSFHRSFSALYARIEADGPPDPSALKSFAGTVL